MLGADLVRHRDRRGGRAAGAVEVALGADLVRGVGGAAIAAACRVGRGRARRSARTWCGTAIAAAAPGRPGYLPTA
jgi:hypothetical protein